LLDSRNRSLNYASELFRVTFFPTFSQALDRILH
jgi:hypothetical protein